MLLDRQMRLLFQNRLAQRWPRELRQIDSGLWSSALLIAFIVMVGAINLYSTIVVTTVSVIGFSGYLYQVYRHQLRTRFFAFLSIWWSLYMAMVVEFILPLLEILPEEHFILVALSCLAGLFAWKVNRRSQMMVNHVQPMETDSLTTAAGDAPDDHQDLERGTQAPLLTADCQRNPQESRICHLCQRPVSQQALHCGVCGFCVQDGYHHSYILNCCISPLNHCQYLVCLMFCLLALLLAANLMLTTICHPFLLARVASIAILLPDDCSNVFDTYPYGLAMMAAVYATLWSTCILFCLLAEIRRTIHRLSRQRKSPMLFGGIRSLVSSNRRLETTTNAQSVLGSCIGWWRKLAS